MDTLPDLLERQNAFWLIIVPGPRVGTAPQASLWRLVARLASRGPLRVLDGGNRFNLYAIARALAAAPFPHPPPPGPHPRPHPRPALDALLERISIARAFTCYQVLALLCSVPASPAPTLVLDLLATFYDENVSLAESRGLLEESLAHLGRLSRAAPLVVIVYLRDHPICQERAVLLEILQSAAGETWRLEPPSSPPPQAALPGL